MALWSYGTRCKLSGGVYGSYTIYSYMSTRTIIIYLLQMTWYHTCGTPYCNKVFSLYACAADQFNITTLTWTREIFPVKQIAHVAIANTYTSMKTRDVEKENQRKSSFVIIFPRGKVKYNLSYLCEHKYKIFICCLK